MHIRTKGRLAGLAFLAATSLMAEAGPAPQTPLHTAPSAALAASLQSAPSEARDSLQSFVAHALDAAGRPRHDARIKVSFHEVGTTIPGIWVQDFSLEGNRVVLTSPGTGTRRVLAVEAVQDWSFSGHDGRLYGAFSTRAAAALMPLEAATAVRALLTDTPCPGPCAATPQFSP